MIATMSMIPTPNDTAERLIGRPYFSFSAMTTYRACPLRFWFRYVEGLPEKFVASSLVFGGAVHAGLESHFREILAGNPSPSTADMMTAYQLAWLERDPGTIRFGKSEDRESLDALAERMFETFQASNFADPKGVILGVEEELRGPIVDDGPDLLARLDLVVDAGDAVEVVDFKTSRSRWSSEQVETSGEQLLLYHALAQSLAPGKPIRLKFVVLSKTKTPTVETHAVPVDSHRIERTKRTVSHVWNAIKDQHFYPNPSPLNCTGCPFRAACREWCG